MINDIKIILASKSKIRADILKNAGINFTIDSSTVDEDSIKDSLLSEGSDTVSVSQALADLKAQNRSILWPNHLIIGADQILEFEGKIYSKPRDIDDLKIRLSILSGKKHKLFTAVSIALDKKVVWRNNSISILKMRNLTKNFINNYLETVGYDAINSVGGYQIEGIGIQLFEKIEGDYFSILGLPILPILEYLRDRKIILK